MDLSKASDEEIWDAALRAEERAAAKRVEHTSNDDLVERLRLRAFHASGYMGDPALERLLTEAADALASPDLG